MKLSFCYKLNNNFGTVLEDEFDMALMSDIQLTVLKFGLYFAYVSNTSLVLISYLTLDRFSIQRNF